MTERKEITLSGAEHVGILASIISIAIGVPQLVRLFRHSRDRYLIGEHLLADPATKRAVRTRLPIHRPRSARAASPLSPTRLEVTILISQKANQWGLQRIGQPPQLKDLRIAALLDQANGHAGNAGCGAQLFPTELGRQSLSSSPLTDAS